MKRREFFEKAGIGTAGLASLPALASLGDAATPQGKKDNDDNEHGHHGDQDEMNGPLASATVAFGQWNLDTPLNRFPNNSPRERNNHTLIPHEVTIKAGGAVNFLIAGFHHLLVYDDGTQPQQINRAALVTPTTQPAPPLINDPVRRLYRGLDPSVFPQLPGAPGAVPPTQLMQDRLEIVRFPNPGRFLVICGVLPHFFDEASGEFIMFGYVRVLRNNR